MIAPTSSPSMPMSVRIRAVYVGLAPSHSSMATSSTVSMPARTATCGMSARSMRCPTIMYSSTTETSRSRGRSPSVRGAGGMLHNVCDCSCAFTTYGNAPTACLRRSAVGPPGASHHLSRRAAQDDDVSPYRPVLDVLIVEASAILDRGVTAQAVHLRPPGDSDWQPVAVVVSLDPGTEAFRKERPFGPRPDQRHVASKHVPQLRQLVETRAPQEPPDGRQPAITVHRPLRVTFVVVPQRAELEHLEPAPVLADPPLTEEDGSRTSESHRHGHQPEDRRGDGENRAGNDHVEHALGPPRRGVRCRATNSVERNAADLVGVGTV